MKRKRSWYHLDHLNSTKMVTDANGEIEVNYIYRAFGEQLKRLDSLGADTDDSAKYSYGGKELDDVTNLYYFNARYYDATIGRFINVDPVQDGTNWYVYCSNNPLAFVDPTGLSEDATEPQPTYSGNLSRRIKTDVTKTSFNKSSFMVSSYANALIAEEVSKVMDHNIKNYQKTIDDALDDMSLNIVLVTASSVSALNGGINPVASAVKTR